jgi:uncharacterized membrane protein YgcG
VITGEAERMTAHTPKRVAWEDRFREPAADELLKALAAHPAAEHLRELRKRLGTFQGVQERIQWQGVPWRWTFVYACDLDPTRAFAYLVPDPAKPQVAIPLTVAMVEALPLKRMKKAVRDAVLFSKFVAGVYWPAWSLEAGVPVEELGEILQRKYRGVAGEWGGAGGGAGGGGGGGGGGPRGGGKKPDPGR